MPLLRKQKKVLFPARQIVLRVKMLLMHVLFVFVGSAIRHFFVLSFFYYMKNLIKGRERKTKTEKNRHLQQKGLYQNINKEELANNRA